MDYLREIIQWRGLDIEVLYNPDWTPIYREIYGYAIGHLQISSLNGRAIPISRTGDCSKFERANNIAAEGGASVYVRAWLDRAAREKDRSSEYVDPRQLSLL